MADYQLAFTGEEIDALLSMVGEGSRWFVLTKNSTINTSYRVGDLLFNGSATSIIITSTGGSLAPGAVVPVTSNNSYGQYKVGTPYNFNARVVFNSATNINGILKGNGSVINIASVNKDYLAPVYSIETSIASNVNTNLMSSNRIIHLNYSGDQYIKLQTPYNELTLPNGCHIIFVAENSGNKIFTPDTGVTIYSRNNMRNINGQYGVVTAYYKGDGVWYLWGDLK